MRKSTAVYLKSNGYTGCIHTNIQGHQVSNAGDRHRKCLLGFILICFIGCFWQVRLTKKISCSDIKWKFHLWSWIALEMARISQIFIAVCWAAIFTLTFCTDDSWCWKREGRCVEYKNWVYYYNKRCVENVYKRQSCPSPYRENFSGLFWDRKWGWNVPRGYMLK